MRDAAMTTGDELPPRDPPVAGRPRRLRRFAGGIVAAAVVVHVLAAWFARPTGITTGQDDAEYVILARSLAAGGYHELHRIDRPVHAQYPPGYPALIAVWSTVAGDGFDALVVLSIMFSAATLVVLWRVLRKRGFGEVEATGSVVVLALNPALLAFAGSAMSESSYMLLTMLCLLLLADEDPGARRVAGAGAVAILAALTRSIGVTLLAAVAAHWLLERRWKALATFIAASAVTVGSWLLWTALAPEQYLGSSYIADLRAGTGNVDWAPGPLLRIPAHIAYYARSTIPTQLALPALPGTPIDNALTVLLLAALIGLGVWTFFRRWRAAALYIAAYGALLAVWLWLTDRFTIPLIPLIVATLLVGGARLATLLRLRRPWLVPAGLALVLTLLAAARTAEKVAAASGCDRAGALPDTACLSPDRASFFDALRWIRGNTADDAVFLASKSAPLWLYTGRPSVSYGTAMTADTATFLPFLRDQGADYILLGALEQSELWQLATLVHGVCRRLELEATFPPHTYIFLIPDAGAPPASGAACEAVTAYLEANEGRLF
ncbi:MAG: glycosyltransferase family 39 protein [Longimicrobiales bacterium]